MYFLYFTQGLSTKNELYCSYLHFIFVNYHNFEYIVYHYTFSFSFPFWHLLRIMFLFFKLHIFLSSD